MLGLQTCAKFQYQICLYRSVPPQIIPVSFRTYSSRLSSDSMYTLLSKMNISQSISTLLSMSRVSSFSLCQERTIHIQVKKTLKLLTKARLISSTLCILVGSGKL